MLNMEAGMDIRSFDSASDIFYVSLTNENKFSECHPRRWSKLLITWFVRFNIKNQSANRVECGSNVFGASL